MSFFFDEERNQAEGEMNAFSTTFAHFETMRQGSASLHCFFLSFYR